MATLNKTIPLSIETFNDKKIKLFDEQGILKFTDVEKWKEDLSNSRWYGPFVWQDKQPVVIFHSVTDEGFFHGAAIGIELGVKRLYYLRFRDNGVEVARGLYISEGIVLALFLIY